MIHPGSEVASDAFGVPPAMAMQMTIFDGSSDRALDLLPWGYDRLVAAERARRHWLRNRY